MLLFSELEKARTATPPPCRTSWSRVLLAERNRSGSIDNNQLCTLFFFSHSLFLSISLSSMTWCIKRPFCCSSLSFLSNSRKRGRSKSPPASHAQMDNPMMKNPPPQSTTHPPKRPEPTDGGFGQRLVSRSFFAFMDIDTDDSLGENSSNDGTGMV